MKTTFEKQCCPLGQFGRGVVGGIFIGIGGTIYLALLSVNKVAAAIFFSIALNAIVLTGSKLFTGSVGFVESRNDAFEALEILIGNCFGAILCAVFASIDRADLVEVSVSVVQAKLEKSLLELFVQACLCGVLMYTAIRASRSAKDVAGKILIITLCVSTFILAGFEHSIADFFYCIFSVPIQGYSVWQILLWFLVLLAGNTIGAQMIHRLLIGE